MDNHGIENANTCEVEQDGIGSNDLKEKNKPCSSKERRFSKVRKEWFQNNNNIKDGNGELVNNYIRGLIGWCRI